jgi:hypothetical protein
MLLVGLFEFRGPGRGLILVPAAKKRFGSSGTKFETADNGCHHLVQAAAPHRFDGTDASIRVLSTPAFMNYPIPCNI